MPVLQPLAPQITEALESAFTVVTANQRAARTLRHQFNLRQRALLRQSWQPPAIFAWDEWLLSLWQRLMREGHATALLLNQPQEQSIWRAIIAADEASAASLRSSTALSETAADAWLRLHAYRGRQRLDQFPGNTDTRAFTRWTGEMDRRTRRADYLTQLPLATDILLVGFDSRTPAQDALIEAFRENGTDVRDLADAAPSAPVTLASALNSNAELNACARWLRERLIAHPQARIAVIVPALESTRAEIDRVFREVLAPELNDIASPLETAPYEFSLGHPLAQMPMIAAALDILRWALAPIAIERVSTLLLSPYFAAAHAGEELLARAEFDATVLRRQNLLRPEVSLDDVMSLATARNAARLPILTRHLAALRPLYRQRDLATSTRSFADWGATMQGILDAAGWAAIAQLDSVEYQTRHKWEAALDQMATLDFEGERISFADALEAIERIAADTLFAPESRHAPVQVMGPLESAGSTFDAIWFLQANDVAWPQVASPNPLLPWLLQRELSMPGANPALDATRANRITQRIAGSAAEVIFSYAMEDADGRLRPSSTLTALPTVLCDAATLTSAPAIVQPVELEALLDEAPIPPPPDRVLTGGAAILQAQAACAFRAFAEKRLFSTSLEAPTLGLDARQRGSLVHAVLDRFWAEVNDQARLKAMTDPQREAQLLLSIDAALQRDYPLSASGWTAAYLDAERQRLVNLLKPWLEFEANERAPFTVDSREKKLEDVAIGPLRIAIRVDRIDRVDLACEPGAGPEQGEVILDYKTSDAKPSAWLDERPDEPQLPLYAILAGGESLAGVAFAVIRPGNEMALRGYEAQDGLLPKSERLKTGSFADQLAQWREILTTLAQDFYDGDARVSPKRYPRTCEFCEQRLLCRLDVASLDAEIVEELQRPDTEESGLG
jgi:ATP-dependent helicase/nuclease subunit B